MLADLPPDAATSRQVLLESLRCQVRQLEGVPKDGVLKDKEPTSSGCSALDRLLPAGGLRRGTLVEWLTSQVGTGVLTLAFLAAKEAAPRGEAIVVCDRHQQFYAPAAVALGIAPAQLVILRPTNAADEIWALDQALRCCGVAMVWAYLANLDERDFRRLQLAAEEGGTVGLLGRPAQARGQPSWSDVQFVVEPIAAYRNRRLRVELARIRGGVAGASVVLEIDDITGQVREVPEHETLPVPTLPRLASATTRRRQA